MTILEVKCIDIEKELDLTAYSEMRTKMTALYSVLHMLIDGVCAIAMFGWFHLGEQGYLHILLYNFCAFALQMPLGVILDLLNAKNLTARRTGEKIGKDIPLCYVAAGTGLTLVGAFTHPVILGLGNALFHLGGGVDVIREDQRRGKRGKDLGVFVAPGALGLFLGGLLAKKSKAEYAVLLFGIVMIGLLVWLRKEKRNNSGAQTVYIAEEKTFVHREKRIVIFCCLAVVILRSYIGMAVALPWKTTVFMSLVSVCAVVTGKIAGGFLAAKFGIRKTIVLSLLIAAVCYPLCSQVAAGWLALFFFNMTMPITLYLLVRCFPELSGFSFGLLTFGLFLGFLPIYFECQLPISGGLLGLLGSLISLLLLQIVTWKRKGERLSD